MQLYDYFRSSASYRARIVLNWKGLDYEQIDVSLIRDEQRKAGYREINPQALVPSLVLADGTALTQSLAICEYLEEAYPDPPLLPADATARARVRALAQLVACDMHPLNNLRVLKYLTDTLGVSEDQKLAWYKHWIEQGFAGFEALLRQPHTGTFCHGEVPSLADVCLVPQVFNARRFDCDLTPYPTLVRIAERCEQLPAFSRADPARQPGAT